MVNQEKVEQLKDDIRSRFKLGDVRPVRGNWGSDGGCCALSAAYLSAPEINPELKPWDVAGPLVTAYVEVHYGLPSQWVSGFIQGWDDRIKGRLACNGDWYQGYEAGFEFSKEFFPDKLEA